jgi:hypothetical protein
VEIPDAKIISRHEARSLIAPSLGWVLPSREVEVSLDHDLHFDEPDDRGGVLLLPPDATVDGNLEMDYDTAEYNGEAYRGVVALGSLNVIGDVRNEDASRGPFLFVCRTLAVSNMLKGGANFVVIGALVSPGVVFCERGPGKMRIYGGLAALGLILDDHNVDIAGPLIGSKLVIGEDDARAYLLPELFHEHEGSAEAIDNLDAVIKARIRAGRPVFRDDAPAE